MLNMLLDLAGYPCPPLSKYLPIFTDIKIFPTITDGQFLLVGRCYRHKRQSADHGDQSPIARYCR